MYNPADLQEDLKITAILGGGLVIMGGVFLFTIAYANNEEARSAEARRQYVVQIQNQARSRADADKNGKVSTEEWKSVYQKLGIPFDEKTPKELSISDLEKYLASE